MATESSKRVVDFSVKAIHEDGRERDFTQRAWELLPPHKNGWKKISSFKDSGKLEKTTVSKSGPTPPETKTTYSADFSLDSLSEQLKKLNTAADVTAFIHGDKRKGAEKLANIRISELKQ